MGQIRLPVAMSSRTKYLEVVERCPSLVNLYGEVGALLIDDRVFGINQMLVVEVSNDLVPDEFDRHDIPFARREVVGAFAVAHGKPWAPVILRSLNEKVIPANVDDRVVVTGRSRNKPDIPSSVESEFEPDEGIFEIRFLVEKPLVLASKLVPSENTVLYLPFFLKKPFVTDLTFGEMLSEMKVAGGCKQGT